MFFKLNNLSSFAVEPCERPWDLKPVFPPAGASKEQYSAWMNDPATKDALVSGFEGLSPIVRIGKENPPVRMHGLVVDYDNRTTSPDKLRELADKPACEWLPAYGSVSFRKGAKLYWTFERPIPVSPGHQAKRFLERLFKELKLQNWLAGFDAGASANAAQYYVVGSEFVEIGGRPIPHEHLAHWAWEAVRDTVLWSDFGRYEIPIEEIEREVHERFPGRWTGQFRVGSRGVRFWDPAADNPTGAHIRADGVTCYTGDKAFVSWIEIFGKNFVSRFAASKTAELLENTYYDGSRFYAKASDDEGGHFVEWDKADFSQYLRTKGFDSAKTKGKTCSELDEAEVAIKTQRRVNMARRLVHFPKGLVLWRGRKFLNMGAPEPVKPAPAGAAPMSWQDGEKFFPFIKSFLDTFFTDANGNDDPRQLAHLLAWLKRFYEGGLDCRPTQGQVVIMSGHAGKGKSLFSEGVVGGLLGGCEDGTDYLVEGGKWSENVAESPVVYVGDSKATEDRKSVASLSNNLKKLVANATLRSAQKYSKEGDVPWYGRIVISCNEDAESLSILPNMEISNREKVSLFRTSPVQYPFPSRDQTEKLLRQELPFFGRFLVDWKIPADLVADTTRFGVKHFHHPFLLDAALQQGSSGLLAEYLRRFLELDAKAAGGKRKVWRGTAADLYRCVAELDKQFEREFRTVRVFSTVLGQLKSRGAGGIERIQQPGLGACLWVLDHPSDEKEGDL